MTFFPMKNFNYLGAKNFINMAGKRNMGVLFVLLPNDRCKSTGCPIKWIKWLEKLLSFLLGKEYYRVI
jgi:hypothetical protein